MLKIYHASSLLGTVSVGDKRDEIISWVFSTLHSFTQPSESDPYGMTVYCKRVLFVKNFANRIMISEN